MAPAQKKMILDYLAELKRERDSLAFLVSQTSDCMNSMTRFAKKYEAQHDDEDRLTVLRMQRWIENSKLDGLEMDENGQLVIPAKGRIGDNGDSSSKVKEGVERLEDLMTDFFINLRTKSMDVFDSVGGEQKVCSNYIKFMSQESDSLLETIKLEVQRMINYLPQRVVVVKDEEQFEDQTGGLGDEDLIDKARNVSKNLRSALNEAEMLKVDAAEDREFDFIWNKLHEDAEKSRQPSQANPDQVNRLNQILADKQVKLDKFEEQIDTEKMLHERAIRELKKENDILLRDNDILQKKIDQNGPLGHKPGKKSSKNKEIF